MIYYYKYKDRFVIWMQLNLRGYYILSYQKNPSIIRQFISKIWLYYIWLCFSEFWYANWRKNDMSCLSSNKAPQIIKKCLIYSVIGRNLIKTYKEVPIIHDKITKFANNYVAMNELMDSKNISEWFNMWKLLQIKC